MNFTEEQKRIFRFVQEESGHGVIDAVAGAGKTTTIMECARYAPNSNSTLFCAFNKSIAKEINKKFREKGHLGVVVKTVHALGFQILRDNNKTAKSIELESKKYRNLLEDKNIQKKLKPYFKKIVKINGYTIESKEDWRSFAVTNILRKATNKLIEANEKFRATLTRNNLDEFIHLVKHYRIFQKIEVDKKDFLKEMKAYFKCHQILLKEGNSYSDRTMKIDLTDMLYLPAKWEQFPAQKFDFVFIDDLCFGNLIM
ncbi:MAG: UvrD-helicase domain-containing protein [Chitinophagales bacterium]